MPEQRTRKYEGRICFAAPFEPESGFVFNVTIIIIFNSLVFFLLLLFFSKLDIAID
jgi:hypothetical protein